MTPECVMFIMFAFARCEMIILLREQKLQAKYNRVLLNFEAKVITMRTQMAPQVKSYYTLLLTGTLRLWVPKITEIMKKSHTQSKFVPIYLVYNRTKTIYDFLFEYKNTF